MKKAPFQKLPYKAVEESTVLLVLVVAVVPELRMEDALEADACGAFPLVMDWVVGTRNLGLRQVKQCFILYLQTLCHI